MTRKSIIIVFFLLILIPKIAQANTEKNTNNNKNIPPAPTLILPDASLKTSKPKPAITGLTANKTEVYIYIDGIYNGKTNILTHESGAANFSYLPFLNLKIGKHQIWAVAKDEQGNKSKISNILTFTIEEHFPAPTLIKIIKNEKRPIVAGLAKNDSLIKVFIDHKLHAQFTVVNHKSGTANFAYIPSIDLTKGNHLIYTTAINLNGKESPWSNMLSIRIGASNPQISETAATEDILPNETSELYYNNIENLIKNTEQELKKASNKTIENGSHASSSLINAVINNRNSKSGIFNENDSEEKSQIQSSIFVIFILIIVGWILWVNKEAINT
ncbi:hypothetical protein A2331_03170 [Candidatus Falkowbacteria bacterium RIFOXYB2_FULL_34_18]|uniref:Bacterial Ig-like domain-containing protein n=1 Tax=Candidatus Falkowbacteria bacterium RIFOXYD2_FULL_34_120 TaxID=1798007 RepID=A0A1F5TMS0_9BACT|nr:MAG: hypothetical protein A2500_00140 [Candidatus Falkowbacteria bacterium RIFOXYC12_FULL_34_55]OGF28633.1 MAG: hypothetical protein A2331_03170 [Candidatus Falkowbacteria bacterium RIFOXYB2_FULL_34_18]OGF38195.1 MAG: hypothetical protein A2466_00065 [Candidatus Falkowbacteria bacterium RIFOXYC2_FULL_34_220]OGF38305.1 MAG: hypothetical protein A2515_00810 [Candidatus Falkowbacteria bacterium RIFOXYD12_FULL_34_57]OGF40272.1 MAG: hypothetical protein A2531_04545 [Candidatus Falkowbacteria bact